MRNMYDDDNIGQLINKACGPVDTAPETKRHIRDRLIAEIDSCSYSSGRLWHRPRLMVPILVSLAASLIAYGYWVSNTIV